MADVCLDRYDPMDIPHAAKINSSDIRTKKKQDKNIHRGSLPKLRAQLESLKQRTGGSKMKYTKEQDVKYLQALMAANKALIEEEKKTKRR